MKWIIIPAAALLSVAAALYILLFTAPGNALIAPYVEKKMSQTLKIPVNLTHFRLGISHFEAVVMLTEKNRLEAAGNYSLFSRSLRARYRAELGDLASLAAVTKQPLRGDLFTEGNVTGTFEALHIDGSSTVARSRTTYQSDIVAYRPRGLRLSVKGAKIADLLSMAMQPAFADGTLSVDADIAPLIPEKAEGTLRISVTEGRFDTSVMQNEFNVTLPKTDFSLNADARFNPAKTDYTLSLNSNLARIRSDGTVTPEPFSAALSYDVRFDELALLKPITNAPLRGPFSTKGSVNGDKKRLTIEGTSDVANSDTAYKSVLRDFKPVNVAATIRHAHLEKLFYLAGEDPLASGSIDADIDLQDLEPKALKGEVHAVLKKGELNKALIRKRFDTAVPDATLTSSLNAALDGDTIVFDTTTDASVGHFSSKGRLVPKQSGMDLTYALDVGELAMFKSLTPRPFRGPLALSGSLKGDRNRLDAAVNSDIAGSRTHLDAVLKAFSPVSAELDVRQLKLKKLLYMLGQPLYADANVNLAADLPNLDPAKPDGKISLDVTDGHTDAGVVAKAFDWPHFKGADFAGKSQTILKGGYADSQIDITSDLMTFHGAPMHYDLNTGIFTADFTASVPDLDRLYFLTERPLRGSADVTGDLRYDKQVTLHADTALAGGNVKATLIGTALHADLKALNTLQALHMLTYPEVFDAALDGTLQYDIGTKQGEMKAQLSNGRFTRNVAFDLLRQYSPVDLYAEAFSGDTVSRIDDKNIDADLALHSNRSHLTSTHAHIDTAAKTIDADVHVDANNNPIDFRLRGAIEHPKVSVDARKLIEREAGKQIKRLLEDFMK